MFLGPEAIGKMQIFMRFCLALLGSVTVFGMELPAQTSDISDQPRILVPGRPLTRQELNHRKALTLYGLGMLRQKQDRLVEATHLLEDALTLDAESAAIPRALFPLYLALGRRSDALEACKNALDLDPGDYATWNAYARQLKNSGNLKEARTALMRALDCDGVGDRFDLRLRLHYDLGSVCEELQQFDQALAAFALVVKGLESAQAPVELDSLSQAEIQQQAASTLERMIKLCIEARQYDRGLTLFAEAQKKYPQLGRRLYYHLARVHAAQGRPEKALGSLDAFLKTQPTGADVYEFRISLLRRLHREAEIVSSLKAFSDLDSKNLALRLLLARQYAVAGKWVEAREVYQAMAEESPTAEIYRGLFHVYQHQPAGRGLETVLVLVDDAIARATPR